MHRAWQPSLACVLNVDVDVLCDFYLHRRGLHSLLYSWRSVLHARKQFTPWKNWKSTEMRTTERVLSVLNANLH